MLSVARGLCQRSVPSSASSASGSTLAPFTRTVQCRCGPVTLPVAPTSPTTSPVGDGVAFVDVDTGQVRKQREQAEAMVDDHRIAREVLRPREHDTTGVGRLDRSSFRAEKIGAAVRAAWLAIEHAPRPESAVGRVGHRPEEGAVPELRWRRCRPDAIERLRIALDLLDGFRRRVHEGIVHGQRTRRERSGSHDERVGCSSDVLAGACNDFNVVGSGRRRQIDADEGLPFRGRDPERGNGSIEDAARQPTGPSGQE